MNNISWQEILLARLLYNVLVLQGIHYEWLWRNLPVFEIGLHAFDEILLKKSTILLFFL